MKKWLYISLKRNKKFDRKEGKKLFKAWFIPGSVSIYYASSAEQALKQWCLKERIPLLLVKIQRT